jgi:hypothetical protein
MARQVWPRRRSLAKENIRTLPAAEKKQIPIITLYKKNIKHEHVAVFKLREVLSCVPCIVASMHHHKTYVSAICILPSLCAGGARLSPRLRRVGGKFYGRRV